jgi:hypothetical protein
MLVLILCDDGVACHVLRVTDEWGTDRERLGSPSQARRAPPPPRCLLITSSTHKTQSHRTAVRRERLNKTLVDIESARTCLLAAKSSRYEISLRDFTLRCMRDV